VRTNKRVGALLRRGDKILLIHRHKNGLEYWVLPGGGIEDDESLEEALRREVMEETSLEILGFELIHECPGYEGRKHFFFEIKTAPGMEPVLGGPEKEKMNENNMYVLEWIDREIAKTLVDLFPEEIREFI
jgi:8-oxo-dGTP diphosphatase